MKEQGAVDSGIECLQHCSAEEKVQLRAVEKEELKKVQQVEANSKKELEKAWSWEDSGWDWHCRHSAGWLRQGGWHTNLNARKMILFN